MKGQTAIEYLMTYGWAILIILIVAGVLAYYGIFAPSGFLGPTARGFGTVAVISPWDLSSANALRLQVENRVGQDITITDIYANNTPEEPTDACTGMTDTLVSTGNRAVLPTVTCAGAQAGSVGSSYSISVAIEYTAGTMTGLKSSGTLTGTVS